VDATGNPIWEKFSLGKRVAINDYLAKIGIPSFAKNKNKRKIATTTTTTIIYYCNAYLYVNGETIELDDSDDDYGNLGVTKGTLSVIECDSDEAIGIAPSSSNNNIPIHIDQSLYQSL